MTDDPRLDDALRALPTPDAPNDVAARVRRQAMAQLALQRDHADRPWLGTIALLWSRIGMPLALASVVGVYLVWAFRFAGALYR